MLYQNKNNVYYLGVDTYVKLLLDCVELLNLMKNKNTNYIISWEKRGNPIKSIPALWNNQYITKLIIIIEVAISYSYTLIS